MKIFTLHTPARLSLFWAFAMAYACPAGAAPGFPEGKSAPLFSAPQLVEVGKPFALSVSPNQTGVQGWIVHWGDGSDSTEQATASAPSHTYQQSGVYQVKVAAQPVAGSEIPAIEDYSQLILNDQPVAYYRFGTPITGNISNTQPALDGSLHDAPRSTASGLPWGARAGFFDHSIIRLSSNLATPSDRFSVDFWLRSQDLLARQEILSSRSPVGSELYLAGGKFNFKPSRGADFSQPLPSTVQDGAWHHIALSYDRAPLFPFQNVTRFYLDGVLLGEQHLDLYDSGPVAFPHPVLGSTSTGAARFKGTLAEFALYAHILPPQRIRERVKALLASDSATIMAAQPCVEPFTVDGPQISQTVTVLLDPAPGADNGPVLRSAIENAKPGTRLLLVNKATNKPGGTFHVNSLDRGNDWSAFRIFGKQNFEIDGGGATFVFGVACRQFFINKGERVALRNFSIDLDQTKFRVGVYARILDLDPTTGAVRFQFVNGRDKSPDMGVPRTISMWRWRPHDPKTLRITKGPYFKTGEAFVEAPQRNPKNASILTGRIKPSLIPELKSYRRGANFFMVNNARFENTSMSVYESEHITIDRINYYATLGMVFLSGEENHIRVTNCKIGLPPGLTAADRPLASGADGYHFHDTQGDILFENNEIALTDDDPITIKDGVWRDVTVTGSDTLLLKGNIQLGDEIELYNWDFSPLNYRAHVVRFDHGSAQMDQPLPAVLPKSFTALDLQHHTQNWILRDSYLHDYYGRLLLCTANGLITGNTIEHSWLHLGASNASFDSAGISSFVTVYNNLLVDTDADTGIWGAASTYPVFRGITFYQNSFVGGGLRLGNAGNPWVADNYFELRDHPDQNSDHDKVAVKISESHNPSVLENVELIGQPGDFSLTTKTTEGLDSATNSTLVSPAISTAAY